MYESKKILSKDKNERKDLCVTDDEIKLLGIYMNSTPRLFAEDGISQQEGFEECYYRDKSVYVSYKNKTERPVKVLVPECLL